MGWNCNSWVNAGGIDSGMFKLQAAVVIVVLGASVQLDAAHPSRELSAAEAKAEGLIVRLNHNQYIDDMRVSLSVPVEKHGTLESMSFSYVEDGKTIISSAFPFREIVKGRANGVIEVRRSHLKNIKLVVVYRAGAGGMTYFLGIPDAD
jgi:hypothetical protein